MNTTTHTYATWKTAEGDVAVEILADYQDEFLVEDLEDGGQWYAPASQITNMVALHFRLEGLETS